jgi:transcriptional regulator with XRE-family HTH domain
MKKVLSANLRELRGSLSQTEFARKIGVKQTSYSGWESGAKVPAASVIAQIATTLGVSADWVLGIASCRGGAPNASAGARIAELERQVEDLRVRNKALMDALEAVGKGALSSRRTALGGAGARSA